MTYHKKNLKEQLAEIAWEICKVEPWKNVNMRRVAEEAGVSTTAFYRHFKNKADLKVELMRKGFLLLYEGSDSTNAEGSFASYGAHTIRFGLEYPYLYDLMFESKETDVSLYPELKTIREKAFDSIVEGVKASSSDKSEKEIMLKAYNIWASVHGIIGILRSSTGQEDEPEILAWIEQNLEEYLRMTTF